MSMLRNKVFVLLLLLLAFGYACLAQETITVPDDYLTIQAAIDAANPGDTVYIKAGRYTENITITKPLHLVGEDRTKVVIQPADTEKDVIAVELSDGEVSISGIRVSDGHTGIYAVASIGSLIMLKDVIVAKNQFGVVTFGDGLFFIKGSYFVNNISTGLQLGNAITMVKSSEILLGGTGLVLVGSVNVTLNNNLIGLCRVGIYTHTQSCGWTNAEKVFRGAIAGAGNRVYVQETALCPDYPGSPWPDEFIDKAWGDRIAKAADDDSRGVSLYGGQDYEGALNAFQSGLALLENAPFSLLTADFNNNIGNAYTDMGNYKDALISFQSARAVFISYGMDVNVAKTDNNIANVYINLGRYEDAVKAYQSARAVFASHGMDVDVATIDMNIGNVYSYRRRYEDAVKAYQSARVVFVAHNMDVKVAIIDQDIGVVYEEIGQYENALNSFQSARLVFANHGMDVYVAHVDGDIGIVYYYLGRYKDAIAKYQSAQAVYKSHIMDIDVARTDQNTGSIYGNLGRYEDALAKFESARAVFASHEMDVDAAKCNQGIGVVYDDLGRYEEAIAAYKSAQAVFATHGMDVDVATINMNIGVVDYHRGRYQDAPGNYNKALGILDQVPPVTGMEYSYPALRWVILENEGECYEKLSKWKEAREAYRGAITVIESLRGCMRSAELKTSWQEKTQYVYELLIKLLIDHGEGTAAFPYAERCRARTFLDALYQGSIKPNQLISPEAGISSGAIDPDVIDEAIASGQGELKASEAVLEYFVTDTGIYLWVVTSDGISAPIFIKYPREQLMKDVITLRQTLESSNLDQITRTQLLSKFLTSFYAKLVKPGLDKLTGKKVDTLIFIPSGPLWYLPFSALQATDQETGTASYLIEHYTIAYLPSLASLSALTKEGAQPVPEKPMIALADPAISVTQLQTSSKCAVEPLPRYPGLVQAAEEFADALVGGDTGERYVYAGSKAQEGVAYTVEGEKVEVYAAHGQFNPYVPLQSKLLLAPGGETTRVQSDSRVPDGNYHAWEALLTDHRGTELVVLAACESLLPHLGEMKGAMAVLGDEECDQVKLTSDQLEQIVVGDEVVGLARAFLSSGAEAVLGTLWLANSTAVQKVLVSMAKYHKNKGETWAQALAKAQRDLIKDAAFTNPWLWAPYQLIGRWR